MTDLITTHQACAIYGCRAQNLTKMAKKHRIQPRGRAEIVVADGYRTTYLWHPQDILKLRAMVRVTESNRRRKRNPAKRPSVKRRMRTLQLAKLRAYYQTPRDQRTSQWMATPLTGTPNV